MSETQHTTLIDAVDAAALFGVDRQTLMRWLKRGLVPAPLIHDRNVIRWRKQDILAFLQGPSKA